MFAVTVLSFLYAFCVLKLCASKCEILIFHVRDFLKNGYSCLTLTSEKYRLYIIYNSHTKLFLYNA
jgi:hypothetical protein